MFLLIAGLTELVTEGTISWLGVGRPGSNLSTTMLAALLSSSVRLLFRSFSVDDFLPCACEVGEG